MVQVKMKTFEDFFGDVADSAKDAIDEMLDDAKDAFDEILERTPKNGGSTNTVSVVPGVRGAIATVGSAGDVSVAIAKLSGSVSSLTDAVGALSALPEPIAELTKLISNLLVVLQQNPGALASPGSAGAPVA